MTEHATPGADATNETNIHLEYEILSTTNEFFGTVRNITLDSGYVAELDMSEVSELLYGEEVEMPHSDRHALARKLLAKIRSDLNYLDSQIDASNFRRVFERIGTPATYSLELVMQYYLSKKDNHPGDRDKLDLLATRWGSYPVSSSQKFVLLRPAKDLDLKLEEICRALNIDVQPNAEEESILDTLDQFSIEIASVTNSKEIVDKRLVQRLREYKVALKHFFFRPKVLARIIEVNTGIYNLFQQLYASEQARLHLYLEQAKKSALKGDVSGELIQYQPLIKMMKRATEMDQLLNTIKTTIATQQVIDQNFIDEMTRAGQRMSSLSALLVNTLQTSRRLGDELNRSLTNIQLLERINLPVSFAEKGIIEYLAINSGKGIEDFIRLVFEKALIQMANAVENDMLEDFIKRDTESLKEAVSKLLKRQERLNTPQNESFNRG